jgi:hypothetical protein
MFKVGQEGGWEHIELDGYRVPIPAVAASLVALYAWPTGPVIVPLHTMQCFESGS